MEHRLLIIVDQPFPLPPDLVLPACAGFQREHVDWNPASAVQLATSKADLIVILAHPEQARAIALLEWFRTHPMAASILAILSSEADEELLRVASETADDFMLGPPRALEFQSRAARLLSLSSHDVELVHDRLTEEVGLAQLLGNDPAFSRTIRQIPTLAVSNAPVLIAGETGTGKELCSRAIHQLSKRSRLPFIPVDCGALPEHLAENEIFGHMRGAFTDAHTDQKGLVAMAEGGTLFLDEIDSLSLPVQAKLLRLLEDGFYRPLGAERFNKSNLRIVAATNRDLESCIRERQFRSDLYFRLKVLQLRLPPLRERRGDIVLLARHFLKRCCEAAGVPPKSLSPGALRLLEAHNWPGNVRELFNVLQGAAVLCAGPLILPAHVSLSDSIRMAETGAATFQQARQQAIETFERSYVEEMLRKHHGNITRAADAAGKDRWTFGRLVKKYGVSRNALASWPESHHRGVPVTLS